MSYIDHPGGAVIPLIDLDRWFEGTDAERAKLAAEVDDHLQRLGFLVVVNHRLPAEVIETTREACKAFFHQPPSGKATVGIRPEGYRGWVAPDTESNAATFGVETPPDAKETFACGPVDLPDEGLREREQRWYGANLWPDHPSDLQEAMESWWRAGRTLSDHLLEVFATALGLPSAYLVERCQATIAQGVAHWYWPRAHRPPVAGEFRVGPHTDFGTLTILDRQPGLGGLQVLDQDGDWIDAPVIEDSLVINTGDLMRRWTNDRWCSNEHRVLPPPETQPTEELISLVFFHSPDHDAVIEALPTCTSTDRPPRHARIAADVYLGEKLDALAVDPS